MGMVDISKISENMEKNTIVFLGKKGLMINNGYYS